ncbi:MAG: relaxase/mobilization nuclease domain-containing protein [Bacteroidota bacterium]
MIIKIKSHKRDVFEKILQYMMNNKDRLFDKDKSTFIITHNLKGKSINDWVKQFKANEMLRANKRKDSVRLTHEILSWHREDAKNITLEKMEDMAREYIKLRNPNGIYVAVPHFDKQHFHLHICASGVEYKTGKSLRLSKTDLQKLKKGIQNYQQEKFPELSYSVVRHGNRDRSSLTEGEYQFKLRTGRQTDKEQVITIIKTCYKKANSNETFLELLRNNNLKTYERSGKTTGIIFNGQKFRLNRLGFTVEKFAELEKMSVRQNAFQDGRVRKMGNRLER